MGWAKDHLSEGRRREIASSLFEVTGRDSDRREMIGRCPAAGHEDAQASFSYNPAKDLANCLGCGFKGDLVDVFSEAKGLDKKAGFKAFKAEFGGGLDDRPGRAPTGKEGDKAAEKSKAAPVVDEAVWADQDRFQPLPEEWVERLVDKRGWSREVIERCGLKLGRQRRGGRRRICIPVRDSAGKLRNIRFYLPGGEPKIKSFAKGYGSSRFWPPQSDWADGPVWLVEGEPDALCGLSRGLNAVTSTTGAKALPKNALDQLKGREVIVCYDADRAGVQGAERVVKRLGPGVKSIRVIKWPPEMGLLGNGSWPDKHGLDLTDWLVRPGPIGPGVGGAGRGGGGGARGAHRRRGAVFRQGGGRALCFPAGPAGPRADERQPLFARSGHRPDLPVGRADLGGDQPVPDSGGPRPESWACFRAATGWPRRSIW